RCVARRATWLTINHHHHHHHPPFSRPVSHFLALCLCSWASALGFGFGFGFFALAPAPSSSSRWPARAPSIFSVCAVRLPLSFLTILCALMSLAFLGATVRCPFFVMPPARDECADGLVAAAAALARLGLIAPCAI